MLLDTKYSFYTTHTLLEVEGLRIVYVLPENITTLRDEFYDHAFILFKHPIKPTVEWRKIKNADRRHIHPKSVRRPSSYMNGCALLMPPAMQVEREELLVRIDDHIARLFSYSFHGKRFVPCHLKESVLEEKEESKLLATITGQPLIDISTMTCPCLEQSENQMALL